MCVCVCVCVCVYHEKEKKRNKQTSTTTKTKKKRPPKKKKKKKKKDKKKKTTKLQNRTTNTRKPPPPPPPTTQKGKNEKRRTKNPTFSAMKRVELSMHLLTADDHIPNNRGNEQYTTDKAQVTKQPCATIAATGDNGQNCKTHQRIHLHSIMALSLIGNLLILTEMTTALSVHITVNSRPCPDCAHFVKPSHLH